MNKTTKRLDTINKRAGSNFRRVRTFIEETQETAANAIGRTRADVSRLEHGKRRWRLDEFIAACEAIGIDPKTLLSELIVVEKGKSDGRRSAA